MDERKPVDEEALVERALPSLGSSGGAAAAANASAGATGAGGTLAPRTRAVRAGIGGDLHHGAVISPLHLSTNFTFAAFGVKRAYDYTRSGNPTRDELAGALASLEGGAGAVVTASGMAAVNLALQLLRPGELLVAPHDCYGGTYRALEALAERGHFALAFVDLTDPAAAAGWLAREPRMVWIETPSNPLLRITDVRAVAAQARAIGATVVVDNTFLTPVLQQPLALGADVVVHSTTKYINGHSDVVGGAVIAATAELHERLAWWANCLGLSGAPFDSYLTLRGLRTLHPRLALHQQNAVALVGALTQHPAVRCVHYPGLASHPGHAVAKQQQSGFGAMLSFELEGDLRHARAAAEDLRCFSLAESLGGVESLIAHPATMTHASMPPEARARAGITDTLLRISVGIEASADLVADLQRGLDRAAGVAAGA
ncbi:MAG: cystathionine gamma-synthase [Proteobacteria bacterium]|nr:cystathionine gamma-synthase [Pseudomonadota bacterium]